MRYYSKDNLDYPSVTSILKSLSTEDFSNWYLKLGKDKYKDALNLPNEDTLIKEGIKEGNKIKEECATLGTLIHNQIESYLKEDKPLDGIKPNLAKFVQDYVSTIEIEKAVYWKKQDQYYAGTFDLCFTSKKPLGVYKESTQVGLTNCILDWKNTRSVKYAMNNSNWGNRFPLTNYFLQASAYVGAYNQELGENISKKVKETVVVVNPQKTKQIYIYYCNANKTMFYWQKWLELLDCFYNKGEFNWKYLDYEIELENMIPTRLCLTS